MACSGPRCAGGRSKIFWSSACAWSKKYRCFSTYSSPRRKKKSGFCGSSSAVTWTSARIFWTWFAMIFWMTPRRICKSSARRRGPFSFGAGAGVCGFVKRRSTSFTSTVVRLPFLIAAAAAGADGASARAHGRRQHRRSNDDETNQSHTGDEHDEALSS